MNNEIKAFELTDEQLEGVAGGITTPSINVNPQVNINPQVNTNAVGEGNVILFSNLTNSTVGKVNVTQWNAANQNNAFQH